MATKKKYTNFSLKLMPDGQIKFLEALGDDGPSLVLTIYGDMASPPRREELKLLRIHSALIQLVTIQFDARETDELIACLATILGYEIDTDLKLLTEEFEGECYRAYIRNSNARCPISVEMWNSEHSIRLHFDSLSFHRGDFGILLSFASAETLLKELGWLYDWKLQG